MDISPFVEFIYSGKSIPVMEGGLVGLAFYESTDGFSTFSLASRTEKWSDWDVLSRVEDIGKLRWGFNSNQLGTIMSDQRQVFIGDVDYTFEAKGLDVIAKGFDWGFRQLEGINGRSWVNTTISDIIKDIAKEAELDAEVEDTEGKFTIHQCTQDAATFIKTRLLPLARSKSTGDKARFDYRCYFKLGNILVFKPISTDITRTYQFYRNASVAPPLGQVINLLKVKYNRVFKSEQGFWSTEYRGFNPRTKQPLNFTIDDNNSPLPMLANKKKNITKRVSSIESFPFPEPDQYLNSDVENIAKSNWCKGALDLFTAKLTVYNDPTITVGGSIVLDVRNIDNEKTMHSGTYFIRAIKHIVSRDSVRSVIYLERRQYNSNAG